MSGPSSEIGLVDVTLRDGLQMLKQIVPTPAKIELLEALVAAGIRRAEVGSFVNPKLLPQFSDTAELIAVARQLPELSSCVLVPNRRGFDLALQHAPDEIVIVVSASEAHNKSNINRTVAQSLAELAPMLVDGRLAGVHMRLAIATAFHCPFDGAISHDMVFRVLDAAVETGALTRSRSLRYHRPRLAGRGQGTHNGDDPPVSRADDRPACPRYEVSVWPTRRLLPRGPRCWMEHLPVLEAAPMRPAPQAMWQPQPSLPQWREVVT